MLHDVQAQPSFADTNVVSDLSESSGPVEQLKSKFFGPQVFASGVAHARWISLQADTLLEDSEHRTLLCHANDAPLQDATSQREALGSFTGSNTTGGFDDKGIGRQEDATIDNPNDSPRPKDRSRQGSAQAQSKHL